MKTYPTRILHRIIIHLAGGSCLMVMGLTGLHAHDLSGQGYDHSVKPPETVAPGWVQGGVGTNMQTPFLASIFAPFSPEVSTFWDERFLFVQSTGMPEHRMMIGITNWQQQIPVPQDYSGVNAWRLPLHPVPSQSPASIQGRFLSGAIALAANGIPIFNPQNNRGEISAQIGELDEWGGHCGRADDYHYHAAPLHLQDQVGKGNPIAVALDGYPIYGLTEPDGSAPAGLDAYHGHTTKELGYHYHASTNYPYVNGGFHGEVTEAAGQVDPQPSAHPYRPAGEPLHGATISGFERTGSNSFKLQYNVHGEKHEIAYSLGTNAILTVEYRNGSGTKTETYSQRKVGGGPPPADTKHPHPPAPPPAVISPKAPASVAAGTMKLESPVVGAGDLLPVEFTGDGAGISPPLSWSGVPAGTKTFAILMHHIDPEGKTKWYWTLYNIPANTTSLVKNTKGVGTFGNNSIDREIGYAPPHSKGPGAKTYVITLYALSESLEITLPPAQVSRDVVLAAMKGKVLGSSELKLVYSRIGGGNEAPAPRDGPVP
jgi:phosphatidylethanolamine-binding protein (PEBP) family uncharacterized protein